MQIVVNVPENLPQDVVEARIKAFEAALAEEARDYAADAASPVKASPWDQMDEDSWEH